MILLKSWSVQTIQRAEETLIHCTTPYQLGLRSVVISKSIDLLSLYVLFSQYRSCDNTLGNCFCQISSYSRAYLVIIYKKTKGQIPLGPLLGKQMYKLKRSIAQVLYHSCLLLQLYSVIIALSTSTVKLQLVAVHFNLFDLVFLSVHKQDRFQSLRERAVCTTT